MRKRMRSSSSVKNVREQVYMYMYVRMRAFFLTNRLQCTRPTHLHKFFYFNFIQSMYVYHRSWVFLFHIRSCRTVFFSLFESLSCFLSYMHSTHVLSSLSSLFDLIAAAADAVPPRYSSFSFLFGAHTFLVPTYFSFRYLFALVSVGFCWCSNSATVVFLFNASMDVL